MTKTIHDPKKIKGGSATIAGVVVLAIIVMAGMVVSYNDIYGSKKEFPPIGYKVKESQFNDVSATVELVSDIPSEG